MPRDIAIIDFDDPANRDLAVRFIKQARGLHWFECRRALRQRGLTANAYMWAAVLPAIAEGMTDAWGETVSVDDAHEFCKERFLSRPVIDRATGECKGKIVGSTASLDVAQFAEYLNKLIKFAGEELGVQVPSSAKF